MKLLEHGVVDPQFVIEAGRLPNGPALIKRVEDRRQQLAEAGFVKQAINLGVKKHVRKNSRKETGGDGRNRPEETGRVSDGA